jgi:PAS domain S-box-containing protein
MAHYYPPVSLSTTESPYLRARAALAARGGAAPQETIDAILRTAAEELGMACSLLTRLLPEQNQAEVMAAYHATPSGGPAPGAILSLEAGATPPAPFAVPDTDADPARNSGLPAPIAAARSYIGVPVRLAGGSVYGTLWALDPQPHLFAPADTQLLEVLAHLLAAAIDRDREQAVRARLEQELQQQREFGLQVMNTMGQGLYTADPTGRFEYVNRAFARMLGTAEPALLGRSARDVTFAHDDLLHDPQTGQPPEGLTIFETRLKRDDGPPIHALVTLAPRRVNGAVAGTIGVVSNLTGRKQVDEALRTSERRFHAIFDSAAMGIALTDLSGAVIESNRALQDMLGYGAQELGRLASQEAGSAEAADVEGRLYADLLAGQRDSYQVEQRYIRKDGSVLWGRRTASLVRTEAGEPQFVISVVEDITTRKQAEEALAASLAAQQAANRQLAELNQAKSDFVSIVSHEFRTPLTVIQGFSEMLRDEEIDPEEIKEYAGDINTEAVRLNRMINDLLDLERMESGRMTLHRQATDLNSVIRDVVERMRPNAPGHTLALDLDPALPIFEGDQDKLVQVLTNLLHNAVKYSPDGGEVLVASRGEGPLAHVAVHDQGLGIPADALETIFERYARIESAANRHIQGTGLGLPIVRQIVEMHGGRVWAESTLGTGSVFHITIPLDGLPGSATAL